MIQTQNVISKMMQQYLKFQGSRIPTSHQSLIKKQNKNFISLKKQLKGTQLSNDLKLKYIQNYEQYSKHVPLFNYDDYTPYVDMILAGYKNILFKDQVRYFGLSSGTSGKDSKKIPYNSSMIKMFLQSQRRLAAHLSYLEPNINFLNIDRLTFGSSPQVYHHNHFQFGYVSGILSTQIPKFLQKRTFPSAQTLTINQWDQKIDRIVSEVKNKDIHIVSGIPNYIISIFDAILKKTGKSNINEIWPNLKTFIYSSTSIVQYQNRIDELVGHSLNYYGVYASTEGIIGLPHQRYQNQKQYYILNPDLLYSFSPIDNPTQNISLSEIKINQPYYINTGTPNGLIHYALRDIITFSYQKDELVFEFIGRQQISMNLSGEKTTEPQVNTCFANVQKKLEIDAKHFLLSPTLFEGKDCYLWTLFTDQKNLDLKAIGNELDFEMQKTNEDYKYARNINILAYAQVKVFDSEYFKKYDIENRSKGQFKPKTYFNCSAEYDDFMQNLI